MSSHYFLPAEYAQRLANVRELMGKADLDILLVTGPEDIFYLSGHHTQGYYTFQAVLVPAVGNPILLARRGELVNGMVHSDFRSFLPYDDFDDPVEVVAEAIRSFPQVHRVGADLSDWFLTPARHLQLADRLRPHALLVDSGRLVGALRIIKSPSEVEYIRDAGRIAARGMNAGIEAVREGGFDDHIAGAILGTMAAEGSEYLAMQPFVAVAERSGNMHSAWEHRRLKQGDLVFLEIAACRARYHAALMRTALVGTVVPPHIADWYQICRDVVAGIIERAKPGASSSEIAEAVSKTPGVVEEFKMGRKRVGYSIGIAFAPDWGEGHLMDLKVGDDRALQVGMTFHVPFAMRETNSHGVGFSETIYVGEDGAEKLTEFGEELFLRP
jgi:Xaa-Pro dipeptidase